MLACGPLSLCASQVGACSEFAAVDTEQPSSFHAYCVRDVAKCANHLLPAVYETQIHKQIQLNSGQEFIPS